jgi:1-acyl-sn-glycerol-3-phosphate acyltransferase
MPYKRGRPVIDLSLPFRLASVITFYLIFPIGMLINYMLYSTSYKHRWRLRGLRKAITVSNHPTFLDPVKITGLVIPRLIYQTLLERTVEFPFLGTYIRLLGGVPVPRSKTGLRKILESCEKSFKYRRYLHFYPEGECYIYNQQIREFKTGAFRLAAELDIPIVPMVTVFKDGFFKPWSFLGRSRPNETLVVLDPVYPSSYVKRNENGEIISETIKVFAESVRQIMQKEIDRCSGSSAFYRGQMERVKGIND